ncbi:hypothetical protein [Croceivirga thetidis]|uniref:Pectate lyase superfamily protein domain-containing protein n=1 Tax=Croceivirga thetidis TaxID=2721623 RepID=A0ABX1GPS4_9FLAO|nr:hypothetical protein [Croceivirga thetidis]NKI31922.1 hypothetical protein [Croceivirga thetidis]
MKSINPTLSFIIGLLVLLIVSACSKDSELFEFAIQEEIIENIEEETAENTEEQSDEESESEDNEDSQNNDNSEDPQNNDPDPSDNDNSSNENNGDGVNLSNFGVVGDGNADDTSALQNAFNSGQNLVANSGLTLKISSTINIISGSNQTVEWNGSTISIARSNLVLFIIDKPNGGLTTMNNLLIEGNEIAQDGFQIHSPIAFDNVDIQNLYSATNAPQAFAIFFDNNFTQNSSMTNCDCTGLNALNNNVIGDAIGATRCFGFYVSGIPSSQSTFTVSNFDFGEVWSEDGDVIEILDTLFEDTGSDIGQTYSPLIIENGTVSNWGRRGVKGTGGGYILRSIVFEPAEASNPNLPSSSRLGPSGIIAMGHTYFPAGADSRGNYGIAWGGLIEKCTFNGSSYDTQVILTRSDELTFKNNVLNNGADLQFQQNPRNIYVCNNQFGAGSIIYEQGPVFFPNLSNIVIASDNTFVESNYNRLNSWNSTETTFSCDN